MMKGKYYYYAICKNELIMHTYVMPIIEPTLILN